METSTQAGLAQQRWHALDAVRALALLLGVLLHATLSYLPGSAHWYIVGDQTPSVVLSALFFVIHSFRMLTFFLIAGFFARALLMRRGEADFVRDRWRRIGLPLLLGWPLVLGAIIAVIVAAAWLQAGGSAPPPPKEAPPPLSAESFPLTHLWFLYLLLWLYAAALLAGRLAQRLDPGQRLVKIADQLLERTLPGLAVWLLAAPIALVLPAVADWTPWFGVPTPDHSLYPNLAACVAYGSAFALGWWLQRDAGRWLAILQRRRRYHLVLAFIGWASSAACLGLSPPAVSALGPWTLALASYAYALTGWSLSFALIGYALEYTAGYSAPRRYLADASYWIYLIHLPLLMALQVLASRIQAPWWLEYPAMVVLAMALMLLSYRWLVRGSWIGALLNGRRLPPGAP